MRAKYIATNPFGALEGALEDAVVSALRPSQHRPTRTTRSIPPARTDIAREQSYVAAAQEAQVLETVLNLHTLKPAAAGPRNAPAPLPIDARATRRQLERNALEGVSWFRPRERRARRREAAQLLEAVVAEEAQRREDLRRAHQQVFDEAHQRLLANDPPAVWWSAGAEVHELPLEALVIAARDDAVDAAIVFPGVELIAQQAPKVTPTGKASTRNRTQTERNELYSDALASAAVATMRAAFAGAPRIQHVRILVVRQGELDAEAVLAAAATRDGLDAASGMSALATLSVAGSLLLSRKGRTKAVAPLDRSGLVDALLSEIEAFENKPQPENPFDASWMVEAQQQLAAEFKDRLLGLRPPAALPHS